jgi:hypothetical protein
MQIRALVAIEKCHEYTNYLLNLHWNMSLHAGSYLQRGMFFHYRKML